jgi:hypothetical protein
VLICSRRRDAVRIDRPPALAEVVKVREDSFELDSPRAAAARATCLARPVEPARSAIALSGKHRAISRE